MTVFHLLLSTEWKVCNMTQGWGAGDAIAPPTFLKMGRKVALSTPNISRLVPYAPKRSTLSEPEFEKDNFFSPSHAH